MNTFTHLIYIAQTCTPNRRYTGSESCCGFVLVGVDQIVVTRIGHVLHTRSDVCYDEQRDMQEKQHIIMVA